MDGNLPQKAPKSVFNPSIKKKKGSSLKKFNKLSGGKLGKLEWVLKPPPQKKKISPYYDILRTHNKKFELFYIQHTASSC